MAKKQFCICPRCRRGRWLSRKPRNPNRVCLTCHNQDIAPLGYAATKAIYGDRFAIRFLQKHRLENPSSHERLVIQALDQLGVSYEREVLIEEESGKCYLLDFVVGDTIAIEVNGDWFHQYHQERDQRKAVAILRNGYRLIELDDAILRNGLHQQLAAVLR